MMSLGCAVLCVLAVSYFGTAQRQGLTKQKWSKPTNSQTVNNADTSKPTILQTSNDTILPSLALCGKRNVARHKRVIGGSNSEAGTFPWITALGYKKNPQEKPIWLCAGSLVTDRHIVTAGLCIIWAPIDYILSVARLGDLDLNETVQDNATPVDYEVDSTITHPTYNYRTKINNIAIVRLKSKVTFTLMIRPICLPTEDELKQKDFTGYFADVTGWGETEYRGRPSSHLHRTTVEVWNQQACVDTYKLKKAIIHRTMVCAGGEEKNTCYSDIGSPLMVRYSAAGRRPLVNYYLYGIFSHSHRCGITGYPGVYTKVSELMDWILPNLK